MFLQNIYFSAVIWTMFCYLLVIPKEHHWNFWCHQHVTVVFEDVSTLDTSSAGNVSNT